MPRWSTNSRVGMLIAAVTIGVLLAFIPRFVRSQPQLLVNNSTPAITANSLASTASLLPLPKPIVLHIAAIDGGKEGFIDKKISLVSKKFDYAADSFSEGLALVEVDEKYGFIDNSGNIVIQPQFDNADSL